MDHLTIAKSLTANVSVGTTPATLEKMSATWREAFAQALVQDSLAHTRRLGVEARVFDSVLSAHVLKRAASNDLIELKKLGYSNAAGVVHGA